MQLNRALNPSPIKSIQRGVVTLTGTSATVTVAAVNTGKAYLNIVGITVNVSNVLGTFAKGVVTNSTTLTFTVVVNYGPVDVSWELIESV